MRIVFFGSPAAALPSLERLIQAGHSIELVITQPDRPSGRGRALSPPPVKSFAAARGIPVLQPARLSRDTQAVEIIRAADPDIAVVVAYGQIIPRAIFDLPRFKSVNVHFSLLPKYRGAAPVQWAILNGEEKTGVTIFELNENMDEGDILDQAETAILPRETAGELEHRLAEIGAALLIRTIDRIDSLPRRAQDHSRATYAPKLKKENGRIDWSREATEIDRLVRAFSPWPGAFTFWKGRRLIIHQGEPLNEKRDYRWPGQIVEIRSMGPLVCCGSGTVFLIRRLQGENRKAMEANAFLRGMPLQPGDLLGAPPSGYSSRM